MVAHTLSFFLGGEEAAHRDKTACSYRGPAARAADSREPILLLPESFLTLT